LEEGRAGGISESHRGVTPGHTPPTAQIWTPQRGGGDGTGGEREVERQKNECGGGAGAWRGFRAKLTAGGLMKKNSENLESVLLPFEIKYI